ncbi:MAG TPA: type II toxin-antitoxin system RelE/ParE family toxin [Pyrinomonadaceae bacterium]|nr:type II toxin-antitoxin system RelE/ParE family toxin [Pyrinomonadaceae bacterium]
MIRSFRGKDAKALFEGQSPPRFRQIARVAQRKLMQLHAAHRLRDLTIFPGNHLEALKRDRKGQHSIRINDQYRICFVWDDGDAFDVEIIDYH